MRNITALNKAFEAAGFTLLRTKHHQIWKCPCGHTQMASSGSQHGGRGDQNARARLGRILRECNQRMGKAA